MVFAEVGVYFCVAYTRYNPPLPLSEIFSYLFNCLRELSPCHVVREEDWVPVSGRVGHLLLA